MKRILLALSLFPVSAVAQDAPKDYKAETMLKLCSGPQSDAPRDLQSSVCTFRLQGVVSIMVENCLTRKQGLDPAPVMTASPPPSIGAVKQAYRNFLRDSPELWGLPWHHAAMMAISEAFPCDE